jgi:CheY-like chemotaxis protein
VGEAATVAEPLSYQMQDAPLRILIAEDNLINSKFAKTILSKRGHYVTVVENGVECLEALKHNRYDIVLMDIQMPVMNGEDVLLEIRKNESGNEPGLPVIALTAHALQGDKGRFLTEGFNGYLSKPLIIDELLNEIRRIIDHYKNAKGETVELQSRNIDC